MWVRFQTELHGRAYRKTRGAYTACWEGDYDTGKWVVVDGKGNDGAGAGLPTDTVRSCANLGYAPGSPEARGEVAGVTPCVGCCQTGNFVSGAAMCQ